LTGATGATGPQGPPGIGVIQSNYVVGSITLNLTNTIVDSVNLTAPATGEIQISFSANAVTSDLDTCVGAFLTYGGVYGSSLTTQIAGMQGGTSTAQYLPLSSQAVISVEEGDNYTFSLVSWEFFGTEAVPHSASLSNIWLTAVFYPT
jgi:hypothetical protein